jgi:hypothetical protein
MQRLGYLKLLVALARETGPTTLEGLTRRFERAVTSRHQVPKSVADRVRAYLEEFSPRRYPHEAKGGALETVEIQDLYLSDREIPSQSGPITGRMDAKGYRHAVYVEMPPWAVQLGLIRQRNYALTDRGRALLEVSPETSDSFRRFSLESNPFLLAPSQRFMFIYAIMDADGDVLRRAYGSLVQNSRVFTREDVGRSVADALEALYRERLGRTTVGKELQEVLKMREIVEAVRKQIEAKKESNTGMGPVESVSTPRVEPLVDCGILAKPERTTYAYELTEGGRGFLEMLARTPSVGEFIDNQLASAVAGALQLHRRTVTMEDTLTWVAVAYNSIISGLGYFSVREVAALAIAKTVAQGFVAFEITDAMRAVLEAARKYGREVRLSKARDGETLFRLSRTMLQTLAHASHA